MEKEGVQIGYTSEENIQRKLELVTRNCNEVLGRERILQVLNERDLKVYWGTAPTGRIHIAYFVPLLKISDFVKADCQVTILLADLHAFLDDMKAPLHLVQHRVRYYLLCIQAMLKAMKVPLEKINFVTGSSYQLSPPYVIDSMRLAVKTSQRDAIKAGAEVVKQSSNPSLSGLWYPGMQALDEQYLDADAELGGVDQRKIFIFAEKYLPLLGYRKRVHLLNHMVGGLKGGKMSASDPGSKIDILDDDGAIRKKVSKAFCAAGNVEENALLTLVQHIVIPLFDIMFGEAFIIPREEQFGGTVAYTNFVQVQEDFQAEKLSPQDLKMGVGLALERILKPIRTDLESNEEFNKAEKQAYPSKESASKKDDDEVHNVMQIAALLKEISLTANNLKI